MGICGRWFACLLALVLSASISQAKEPKQNKNLEVSVEVKFVSVDQVVVEQLKQQGLLVEESKGKDALMLDNAQMNRVMALIQSNIHSNVMQAPRLTMDSGQRSTINLSDEHHFVTGLEIVYRNGKMEYRPKRETIQLGWRIALRSVVAADRRRVRVHLGAKANNLASEETPTLRIMTADENGKPEAATHYIEKPQINKISINRTMNIPDGNTAVLITGVKNHCVGVRVMKVPVLGDIPYIGRLFRETGYGIQTLHLLVLVTPHILASQEKQAFNDEDIRRAIRTCRCEPADQADDFRTLVLGQYRDNDPQCATGPDEARVLRALPALKQLPGVYEKTRDNIQIVTERIVDKVDPPRFFPLVGPAQLHHCQWKCTVHYDETIQTISPHFHWKQPRTHVVFIDTDHLHLYPGHEPQRHRDTEKNTEKNK